MTTCELLFVAQCRENLELLLSQHMWTTLVECIFHQLGAFNLQVL